jgi:hypothetical protein
VHVNLTSYNRQVLLTGEVPNEQDKQLVEQIVARVDNVRSVVNELAVMGSPTLTQRSSDTLVTGKRQGLAGRRGPVANAFKVVTERGTVYLMGRVTQREADRATEIARGISGRAEGRARVRGHQREEWPTMLPSRPGAPAPPHPRQSPRACRAAAAADGTGCRRPSPAGAAAFLHQLKKPLPKRALFHLSRLIRLDVSQRLPPMAARRHRTGRPAP